MKMTDRHIKTLTYIREYIQDNGYAPTIDEIKEALVFTSKSVVSYHLKALEREGIIRSDNSVARGIEVRGMSRRGWLVPLLGTIAAGEPIPVSPEDIWQSVALGTVEVPDEFIQNKSQIYALNVKEVSMVDALVDDGDIIVLEATSTADNGDMVAV